jgi:hypothetical protein
LAGALADKRRLEEEARVNKIWREEIANVCEVLGVESGRPALQALHYIRLIGC